MDDTEELDDIVRPIRIRSSCEDQSLRIMGHHSLVFTPPTDGIPGSIDTYTFHDWGTIFLFFACCRCSWFCTGTDIFSGWSSECYLALLVTGERLVLSSDVSLHRSLALFPIREYSWGTSLPYGIVFLFWHSYYKKEIQSSLSIASALTRSS